VTAARLAAEHHVLEHVAYFLEIDAFFAKVDKKEMTMIK
jgi:hypothetical protein